MFRQLSLHCNCSTKAPTTHLCTCTQGQTLLRTLLILGYCPVDADADWSAKHAGIRPRGWSLHHRGLGGIGEDVLLLVGVHVGPVADVGGMGSPVLPPSPLPRCRPSGLPSQGNRVGDDVVHPGPLRAPVETLALLDVTLSARRPRLRRCGTAGSGVDDGGVGRRRESLGAPDGPGCAGEAIGPPCAARSSNASSPSGTLDLRRSLSSTSTRARSSVALMGSSRVRR